MTFAQDVHKIQINEYNYNAVYQPRSLSEILVLLDVCLGVAVGMFILPGSPSAYSRAAARITRNCGGIVPASRGQFGILHSGALDARPYIITGREWLRPLSSGKKMRSQ